MTADCEGRFAGRVVVPAGAAVTPVALPSSQSVSARRPANRALRGRPRETKIEANMTREMIRVSKINYAADFGNLK